MTPELNSESLSHMAKASESPREKPQEELRIIFKKKLKQLEARMYSDLEKYEQDPFEGPDGTARRLEFQDKLEKLQERVLAMQADLESNKLLPKVSLEEISVFHGKEPISINFEKNSKSLLLCIKKLK